MYAEGRSIMHVCDSSSVLEGVGGLPAEGS